ncbi:MAG: PepSY domain-containing protein [Oceanospirillum sp.]|nr:PepSY domain-containing protein [Oceanospirillum sp.]
MPARIVPALNRHTFLIIHRWLGLLLILPVLLLTLTGGLLVYKQALDQWLNADLMQIRQDDLYAEPLSVEQLEARIKTVYPQSRISWFGLRFYQGSGYQQPESDVSQTAAVFWISGVRDGFGNYHAPIHSQIFVNPYTGEVLGGRKWGEYHPTGSEPLTRNLMPLIYKLHYSMLAGQDGRAILGWLTLVWLLLVPVGVYLSWPHHAKGSSGGTGNRKKPAFRYDLIHWLGFWRYRKGKSRVQKNLLKKSWLGLVFTPVMIIFLLSGLSFNLKPIYYAVFDPVDQRQLAHKTIETSPVGQAQPMSLEQAVATGQRLTQAWAEDEGFDVIRPVGLSHSAYKGTYLYRSYSSLDYSADSAKTSVWFDAKTGELLARFQATGASSVDTMTVGLEAVHKSELGGWSRMLSLLLVAASVWLTVTGLRIWWFKYQARR